MRLLALTAPILCALVLAPSALAQEGREYHRTATVPSDAFFRAEPDGDASLLGIISAGTEIRLAICAQSWCPVRYEGRQGYVHVDDVYPGTSISYAAPAPAPARAEVVHAGDRATITTHPVALFIASKNGRVYHEADCSHAARIAEHNRVTYASAAEAEEDGKHPCRVCHPGD